MSCRASAVSALVCGPRATAAAMAVVVHLSPHCAGTPAAHCSSVAIKGWNRIHLSGFISRRRLPCAMWCGEPHSRCRSAGVRAGVVGATTSATVGAVILAVVTVGCSPYCVCARVCAGVRVPSTGVSTGGAFRRRPRSTGGPTADV